MSEKQLLDFLGYGRLDVPYWFVGIEEGMSGFERQNQSISQIIRLRAQYFSPVMDLEVGHNLLGFRIRRESNFGTQVWSWMAKIVRGIQGHKDWKNAAKANDYIRSHLGRTNGETLLTELFPLPMPKDKADPLKWPYKSLFSTPEAYYKAVLPKRIAKLHELIATHHPRYVFAYGKKHHEYYRQIVDVEEWQFVAGNRRVETGQMRDTMVFLLPFLGQGAIGTNDVDALIQAIRQSELHR